MKSTSKSEKVQRQGKNEAAGLLLTVWDVTTGLARITEAWRRCLRWPEERRRWQDADVAVTRPDWWQMWGLMLPAYSCQSKGPDTPPDAGGGMKRQTSLFGTLFFFANVRPGHVQTHLNPVSWRISMKLSLPLNCSDQFIFYIFKNELGFDANLCHSAQWSGEDRCIGIGRNTFDWLMACRAELHATFSSGTSAGDEKCTECEKWRAAVCWLWARFCVGQGGWRCQTLLSERRSVSAWSVRRLLLKQTALRSSSCTKTQILDTGLWEK